MAGFSEVFSSLDFCFFNDLPLGGAVFSLKGFFSLTSAYRALCLGVVFTGVLSIFSVWLRVRVNSGANVRVHPR